MNPSKYSIGQEVYYIESSLNYGKEIPCPMCFGKLEVKLILGDGEECKVECGFCRRGCEEPSGMATTWEPVANLKKAKITGMNIEKDEWIYILGFSHLKESEIYATEQEGGPIRQTTYNELMRKKEEWFRDHFIEAKENQIWNAGYHRRQIKDHEKSIEWHRLRLRMIWKHYFDN
jgi:hypothetical protein